MKLRQIAPATLVALTLLALWATAWRIKHQRTAARSARSDAAAPAIPRLTITSETDLDALLARHSGGEVEVEAGPRARETLEAAGRHRVDVRILLTDGPSSLLTLDRNRTVRVEHFRLRFDGDRLAVADARGAPLAEFTRLRPGENRGWQELQVTIDAATPHFVTLRIVLQPGAPCRGSGRYPGRPGLRIEFPGGRSVTVLDAARLAVQSGDRQEVIGLSASARAEDLELTPEGGWIRIEDER